jgi:hypothetical protein
MLEVKLTKKLRKSKRQMSSLLTSDAVTRMIKNDQDMASARRRLPSFFLERG